MNTKEKIFNASLDLFSKKGYDSVSLREIAEEVGIKKSSIYSHYGTVKKLGDFHQILLSSSQFIRFKSNLLKIPFSVLYNFLVDLLKF